MHLEPITTLRWAYRLHYHVYFRTHRRRDFFASADRAHRLGELLTEIALRHDYHLLNASVHPNHVSCLISLQPGQAVSKVVGTLKANSSGLLGSEFGIAAPLWARGYLALAVGRIEISAVRKYISNQPQHHGYASRKLPPVFRYRAERPSELHASHATFALNYHLVFATAFRRGVFASSASQALAEYWLRVAAKHGFAIDQISFVPDHVHLMIRTAPRLSIHEAALALLNNGPFPICSSKPESSNSGRIRLLRAPAVESQPLRFKRSSIRTRRNR